MMNRATLQPTKWFDYSNAGFALLGLALERASHRDFATLMAQRVFAPPECRARKWPGTILNLAVVCRGLVCLWFSSAAMGDGCLRPAGGVRATIVDMAKYARALLAGNPAGSEGMPPVRHR